MLVYATGRLIPCLRLLGASGPRSERVDNRCWLFEPGDPGSDSLVVGEALVDLGDARLEFGSPAEELLCLAGSLGEIGQPALGRRDDGVGSTDDLGLALQLALRCLDLVLVLPATKWSVVGLDDVLGRSVLGFGPSLGRAGLGDLGFEYVARTAVAGP